MKTFTKPQSSKVQFYRVKKGEILDNSGNPVESVQGTITRFYLKQDEGNPAYKIKPHKQLQVSLTDEQGNISVLCVPETSRIAFAYLGVLAQKASTDSQVAWTAKLGDAGVSFLNCYQYNSYIDDWNFIKFEKPFDDFVEIVQDLIENLPNHKLYGEHKAAKKTWEPEPEEDLDGINW
jgi:hypothetical protein